MHIICRCMQTLIISLDQSIDRGFLLYSAWSLEEDPVACAQPSRWLYWVPKWWLLRRGTPSRGITSCTFGPTLFTTYEDLEPRSFMANSVLVLLTTSVSIWLLNKTTWLWHNQKKQIGKMSWVCSQCSAESAMHASLFHRYSATAADPVEGRLDRSSGVSHQCWICQAAGTSGRSRKRRYSPSTRYRHVPVQLTRRWPASFWEDDRFEGANLGLEVGRGWQD